MMGTMGNYDYNEVQRNAENSKAPAEQIYNVSRTSLELDLQFER